jgi:hypothetical protein
MTFHIRYFLPGKDIGIYFITGNLAGIVAVLKTSK